MQKNTLTSAAVALLIVLAFVLGAVLAKSQVELPIVGGGSSRRLTTPLITLFTTSTNANFAGLVASNVADFQHIDFVVVADNASGTVRFACSNQEAAPEFGSASSTTNLWDYVEVIDTEDGSSLPGDAGIVFTGNNDIRQLEVNDNFARWCGARLSGNTTPAGLGTTTVYIRGAQN